MEKKGGKANSTKMVTVQCSICGMDMDCPESMLGADRHFCERCTDLLAESKSDPGGIEICLGS